MSPRIPEEPYSPTRRRPILAPILARALTVAGLLILNAALADAEQSETGNPGERAAELHQSAIVVDGHNDLPWKLRSLGHSSLDNIRLDRPFPRTHTDIPRLRAGGVGAQFWSAFVPANSRHTGKSVTMTLEQIDLIHRMVRRYPDTFELALSAADVERIHREGRIASLIGIEGGHSIDDSLGVLRMYYALGVRYMTLTHSESLAWADASTDDPANRGLSEFGEEVVREMNRLGMLVDLSHVSDETAEDAIKVSRAPVIASHSSAYAIAPTLRNIPDSLLVQIRDQGGVVMVNFYSGFIVPQTARFVTELERLKTALRREYDDPDEYEKVRNEWRALVRGNWSKPSENAGTVADVVRHIDHIARIAGIDHVGLGADYDGVTQLPAQLEDVSGYPLLTQALIDHGYSNGDIRKILGGNILRALREAEKVAGEARVTGGD